MIQLRPEIEPSSPPSDEPLSETENLTSAPILSLFDNAILSRRDDATDNGLTPSHVPKDASRRSQKLEKIRETLLSLFPPPGLEERLVRISHWWRPWQEMFSMIFGVDGKSVSFREFVLINKASGSVQRIAKALLSLTLTFQEEKGSNDWLHECSSSSSLLGNGDSTSGSGRDVERCLKVVEELILSDDELVSTVDGIECLILRSKHSANDGRIRRSWIYYRRGLVFAQLLGLHRRATNYPQAEAQRRESVWKALYEGDRFVSLLLGLPYYVAKGHTDMDRTVSQTGPSYFLRLSEIVGDVIDRNLDSSTQSNYLTTVKIEGDLINLANSMPSDWWHTGISETEDLSSLLYHRLLPQFWHHQVRALLHLPFMLKANQDRQYEYNRVAALESARAMITCYQIFRPKQGYASLVCKIVDFQVFTAAMLLVLNLIGFRGSTAKHSEEDDDRDWDLLISTNRMLQQASEATDGVVASQATRALDMFTRVRNTECTGYLEATCKIVIPYFGTIQFGPGKDFAKRQAPAQGVDAMPQPSGLPTPAESHSGSAGEPANSISDPFISLDSYMAQVPLNLELGGPQMEQSSADTNSYDYSLTDVNLDLDHDWTWYPGGHSFPY